MVFSLAPFSAVVMSPRAHVLRLASLAFVLTLVPAVANAKDVLWSCGYNGLGQLGDGTTIQRTTLVPTKLDGINTDIQQVACGYDHTLALGYDGSVWAWGANWDGQLGDGTVLKTNIAKRIQNIPLMRQVAAGYGFSLALDTNGKVWSWGSNLRGQLGDNSPTFRSTPAMVSGLTQIAQIACGEQHSLAIIADGFIRAWGANGSGQLGDGTTIDRSSPVAVPMIQGAWSVAAGDDHSLALTSDGKAFGWGSNWAGQLGIGSFENTSTPVRLPGALFAKIAAGANHSVATQLGPCFTWGRNSLGQLGLNDRADRSEPTQIANLGNITSVAAGLDFTVVVSNSGQVWTWGDNSEGQLANGANGFDRVTPGVVAGIYDAISVSAGNSYFVVISRQRLIMGSFVDPTWVGSELPETTLSLRKAGSNEVLQSTEVRPDIGGQWQFEVASSIAPGTYYLYAKASHWLQKRVRAVSISMTGVTGVSIELVNGDIDGDNAITVFDYSLLSDAFDSTSGDANWLSEADLDGDGSVTVLDYMILSESFDKVGDD